MIARSILIEGHVQGVFFREWSVGKARELGVTGWVRNLRDGRVEVYAVGEAAPVNRFIERLHDGSPAAQVSKVSAAEAPIERLDSFTRRQTV